MHDIKLIRGNPDYYRAKFAQRGCSDIVDEILKIDLDNRQLITLSQEYQTERNQRSKEIGIFISQKNNQKIEETKIRVAELKDSLAEIEKKQGEIAEKIHQILSSLPNILDDDVPEGKDEANNVEIKKWGQIPQFSFAPKEHDDLGEKIGMDFETASKVSGSRFVYLRGSLARLERALANFMLDTHTAEFGYTEINPPILVKAHSLFGTGQLPKFAEDLFSVESHYLIPTSEVPLTNIVREKIISTDIFPLRFTSLTPCFRSEAGAAGKDTRGMIRQHQFSKVELVSIVEPEYSDIEQTRMLECAEAILQKLKLPYRIIVLCAGDTGFSAMKTYDIEVWLPGQNCYREISSVSNCGSFQARRMNARYKDKNGENRFVHTLNGSGLAVGRTLVAILENYQQQDGSILIPDILMPYMGGITIIQPEN